MTNNEEMLYKFVKNHKIFKSFNNEDIEYAVNYKARDLDLILVTYPKCGTAWTQQILRLIITSGSLQQTDSAFFDRFFLEIRGQEIEENLRSDAVDRDSDDVSVIKTHLNYQLLPYNKSAKYLLVLRNPKDVCVSYYNHLLFHKYLENIDFHQFVRLWIRGDIPYGDYFVYVREYWTECKDRHNFMILFYEQMKTNIRENITKISQFLGQKYVKRLSDNESLIDEIIKNSSFNSMKVFHNNDFHMNKGVVGNWRSYLTKNESDLIDKRVEEEWKGTGLELVWEQELKWIDQ